MTPELAQNLQALSFFKDWTNFLLVTTVAALGWVAKRDVIVGKAWARQSALLCFSLSIMFAIFTLGLIPLVAESTEITSASTSIYKIAPVFDLAYVFRSPVSSVTLKHVCWLQHLAFLLGVGAFCAGVWDGYPRRRR